jgi:hypothetical protein
MFIPVMSSVIKVIDYDLDYEESVLGRCGFLHGDEVAEERTCPFTKMHHLYVFMATIFLQSAVFTIFPAFPL